MSAGDGNTVVSDTSVLVVISSVVSAASVVGGLGVVVVVVVVGFRMRRWRLEGGGILGLAASGRANSNSRHSERSGVANGWTMVSQNGGSVGRTKMCVCVCEVCLLTGPLGLTTTTTN